ncbi:MAG TPA: DUF364 domain-containing protein [Smithellaceae bacterium]|jgi:hypothetical protein|nr:DUF364 domain-containing protein [Syntrophaceae bacterium]HPV50233.1 DUF364 domain-containing protein [Smithellaceae bacterium]
MEILNSILESITEDAPVMDVRRGLTWTAVVSRRVGLASSMVEKTGCNHGEGESREGAFTEMTALELARYCHDNDTTRASLGLAAINSLLEIDPESYGAVDGLKIAYDLGKNKNISIIGHFPDMEALSGIARNFWVIEKRPQPGDYTEEQGDKLLPQSDIVIISSTTLINHTLPGILERCRKDSVKMLLGPSTPLSRTLFDYGLDVLAGSVVTGKEKVLKSVSEGASFRQIKMTGGIRFVSIIKDYDDIIRRLS